MTTLTKPRMNTEEAAEYTGLSVSTMRAYRANGTGPASYKIGRRVFYEVAELDSWMTVQKLATVRTGALTVFLTPAEAVQHWVKTPQHPDPDGITGIYDPDRLPLEPIKLHHLLVPEGEVRGVTKIGYERMKQAYDEFHPTWRITTNYGDSCIQSRSLADLMPWMQEFSELFAKAVTGLEASK